MQHQLFLENIDGKIREANPLVLSVPDEQVALSGATPDGDEPGKVWEVLQDDIDIRSYRRLGRHPGTPRTRPVIITVTTKDARDKILEKTRKVKEKWCVREDLRKEGCPSCC